MMERSFGGFASSVAVHAVLLAALSAAVPRGVVPPAPARTVLILFKPAAAPHLRTQMRPVKPLPVPVPRALFVPPSRPLIATEAVPLPAAPVLKAERALMLPLPTVPVIREEPVRAVADAGFHAQTAAPVSRYPSASITAAGFAASSSGGWGLGAAREVSDSGFGAMAPAVSRATSAPKPVAVESIQILRRPRPAYTDEARRLQIEGEVVLEAVFAATGEVRVIRVVRGLGHGLDESAVAAARNIQFTPARRDGLPVDLTGTVRLTFQLAY